MRQRKRRLALMTTSLVVGALNIDDTLGAAAEAGMHILARQKPAMTVRMDDIQATRRAEAAGITVSPLSSFYHEYPAQQGLMLGYAAVDEEEIPKAVAKLAEALWQ